MKNLKLMSILVLSIVVFIFSSCGSSSSPGDTIKKAYELMKSKDFDKVVTLYATRDGKKLSEEEAKKMEGLIGTSAKKDFDSKDGLKNIVIDEETIDDDGLNARVKYTVHYKNGDTKKENAKLIKIDGKWFIKI